MGKKKIVTLSLLAFGFAFAGMYLMKKYSPEYVHYYPPNISSYEDWPDGRMGSVNSFAQSLQRFKQQTGKYPAKLDELCRIDAIAAVVDPPATLEGECIKGYISIADTAAVFTKIAILDSGQFYLIAPHSALPNIDAREGDAIILADYSTMSQAKFAQSPFGADDSDKFAVKLDGNIFVYSDDLLAEWKYFADKSADYKTLRVCGTCSIVLSLIIAMVLLAGREKPSRVRLVIAALVTLTVAIFFAFRSHPQGRQAMCYAAPAVPPWNLQPAIQLRMDMLEKYHADKKIDDIAYAKLKATLEKQLAATRPTSSPTSKP